MTARRMFLALAVCAALGACGGGESTNPASGDAGTPSDEARSTASESDGSQADRMSSTGGEQPTLEWKPVEGVSLYSVVVADDEGVAYWGWQGADTTVTVGDGAPDPLVDPTMTWSVVALDTAGDVLWESGTQPV